MSIVRQTWPLGWTPSANPYTGNPDGLIEAKNISFEKGYPCLARGTKKLAASTDLIRAMYSKRFSNITSGLVEARYLFSNGNVVRNYGAGNAEDTFDKSISTGGDATRCCFASGWGATLIYNGTKKYKDTGDTQYALGIAANVAPTISVNSAPSIALHGAYTSWVGKEGTVTTDATYVKLDVDPTSLRGIAQYPTDTTNITIDSTAFGGTTGRDTPNDIFQMKVRVLDTNKLIRLRIEFLLETPVTTVGGVSNYYWHEWIGKEGLEAQPSAIDPNIFGYQDTAAFMEAIKNNLAPGLALETFGRPGDDIWGTINCLRSQFKRAGASTADWNAVKGVRVIITSTEETTVYFCEPVFIGGTGAPLNGYYSYMQVDVNNTDNYLEIGLASPASTEARVVNSTTQVTPHAVAAQANECWIFRSSTQTPGYYLVKKITGARGFTPSAFEDNFSDIDALRLGIPLEYYRIAVPDDIQFVVGPYFSRMLYFDYSSMYISFIDDPGSVDSRFQYKICGDDSEYILFAVKIIDGCVLVGTTEDIYEIRGSGVYDAASGTLDFSIRPLGIAAPPVSSACAIYNNNLIYLTVDGWRVLAGTSSEAFSGAIELLFRNLTINGFYPLETASSDSNSTSCTVCNNKFFASMVHKTSGTRCLLIFDFMLKTWEYWTDAYDSANNPHMLYTTENGTLLFGTSSVGDKDLYRWGTDTRIDESIKNPFSLTTVVDFAGKMNQRKGALTFTIVADTKNYSNVAENITIKLRGYTDTGYDEKTITASFNGKATKVYDISPEHKGGGETWGGNYKGFQIVISGTVERFELFEYRIDYVEHPEQLKFLRIPGTNFGVPSRKRASGFQFELDAIDATVKIVPILDQTTTLAAQSFTKATNEGKKTYTYNLEADITFIDVEFLIYSESDPGFFEFYQLLPPLAVEQLPPATTYLVLPRTNLGSDARKRAFQVGMIIDTKGETVRFTPYLDSVPQTAWETPINTSGKEVFVFHFTSDKPFTTLGGVISGLNTDPTPDVAFEWYGWELSKSIFEELPAPTKYIYLQRNDLGSPQRKRLTRIAFYIDTKGNDVTFTPYLDGAVGTSLSSINTSGKTLVYYYYTADTVATEIGGIFTGTSEFEFYGLQLEGCVSEIIPPSTKYLYLPANDFGSAKRKRFVQVAFVINTMGNIVTLSPYVDGIAFAQDTTIQTWRKTVYIYYFTSLAEGIEFSAILSSSGPFEFYKLLMEESIVTVLPVATKYIELPSTNYGSPRKKRVRTVPFVINTEGHSVTITPYVDGVAKTPLTFSCTEEKTQFYYFEEDVFGIDYRYTFSGSYPFYLRGMLDPEIVEILPVSKKLDQIGPIEFNKAGRVKAFRLRVLPLGTVINYRIYAEDVSIFAEALTVQPNVDNIIDVLLPKGVNVSIYRMELWSTSIFHRHYVDLKIDIGGEQTQYKIVRIQ